MALRPYAMLCYDMLCYAMLSCAMLFKAAGASLEDEYSSWQAVGKRNLEAGKDFDAIVLISPKPLHPPPHPSLSEQHLRCHGWRPPERRPRLVRCSASPWAACSTDHLTRTVTRPAATQRRMPCVASVRLPLAQRAPPR